MLMIYWYMYTKLSPGLSPDALYGHLLAAADEEGCVRLLDTRRQSPVLLKGECCRAPNINLSADQNCMMKQFLFTRVRVCIIMGTLKYGHTPYSEQLGLLSPWK